MSSTSFTLISSDGVRVEVSRTALQLSEMLQDSLQTDTTTTELRLQNIDSSTLQRIAHYLNYHEKVPPRMIDTPLASVHLKDLVDSFDAQYADECDQEMMFKLMLASNYLNIKPLLSLMSAKCASLIKGPPKNAAVTKNILTRI